jgi:hypothetical protein
MKLTIDPTEHLTFNGSGNTPILRILSLDQAFELYRIHIVDTRLATAPGYFSSWISD